MYPIHGWLSAAGIERAQVLDTVDRSMVDGKQIHSLSANQSSDPMIADHKYMGGNCDRPSSCAYSIGGDTRPSSSSNVPSSSGGIMDSLVNVTHDMFTTWLGEAQKLDPRDNNIAQKFETLRGKFRMWADGEDSLDQKLERNQGAVQPVLDDLSSLVLIFRIGKHRSLEEVFC